MEKTISLGVATQILPPGSKPAKYVIAVTGPEPQTAEIPYDATDLFVTMTFTQAGAYTASAVLQDASGSSLGFPAQTNFTIDEAPISGKVVVSISVNDLPPAAPTKA